MIGENKKLIKGSISQHLDVVDSLNNDEILDEITKLSLLIANSIKNKGTIFWCGNGGSAADSQHLAAELVCRFNKDRPPLASRALSTDTSILTSISNDYSYEEIFSRQISALAKPKDILVGISTSGNSKNVDLAICKANEIGCNTIAFLGKDGGRIINSAKNYIVIGSDNTARIQEAHILVGHLIIEAIEKELGFS
tara:strand:- start:1276 stop:1863 length:588 start_codon:yes stop_codon:yes gene_type:complete